jgi:hypothetical protein
MISRRMKLAAASLFAIQLAWLEPVNAQEPKNRDYVVTIYKAAPGQQVALLRWMAEEERVAEAAGVPKSQLYDHFDGADWDYIGIAPLTTAQEDDAMNAARKRMGFATGPRRSTEFRRYILHHTDTLVHGPTTATDLLKAIGDMSR